MATTSIRMPNPRRVQAGKRNRMKRGELTPEGRERLRQSAIASQPWRFSTGPRSAEGKARVAQNGKCRQKGPRSVREIRATMAELRTMMSEMQVARAGLGLVAVAGAAER